MCALVPPCVVDGIWRSRLHCAVSSSIFDARPVPVHFAPSLYKYMLGIKPNLHDLAAYSPVCSPFVCLG